jgi:glycosyltransferase involved in cell wall biosynthesis
MRINNLAIVIAVKNGAATIEKALISIMPAISSGAKLYVFDSLSTDGTPNIVKNIYPDVNYFYEKDNGLYFAWNKAIEIVEERYILFLNADDKLNSHHNLVELVKELENDTYIVAAGGKTQMVREDGVIRYAGQKLTRNWFVGDMPFVTLATIFRTDGLRKISGFDVQYRISADYEMLLKLLREFGYKRIIFKDLPIINFSLHGMSNQNRAQAFAEVKRIVYKKLGLSKFFYHSIVMYWIEFKRIILGIYFRIKGAN